MCGKPQRWGGQLENLFCWNCKKTYDGTFETCKLHVEKNQNDKSKTIGYMVRMFYKALEVVHPNLKNIKYFSASFNIVSEDKSKSRDENIHPFARFVIDARQMEKKFIEWSPKVCAEQKLDRDAIMDKFMYFASDPADRVEWCL